MRSYSIIVPEFGTREGEELSREPLRKSSCASAARGHAPSRSQNVLLRVFDLEYELLVGNMRNLSCTLWHLNCNACHMRPP